MKQDIRKLSDIAEKPKRQVIGLMSGTSLDGLDVALCEISGSGLQTKVTLQQFKTVPYSTEVKTEIRKVFARQTIDFQVLALLNPWIGQLHAQYILQCLSEWNVAPEAVDLIASHGQTVMHAPQKLHGNEKFSNATLQIGDGDHIAVQTGIITVSDFRQKHVAAGGEGAPLALYGDFLLFSAPTEDRILLNCGGIANFTCLCSSGDASRAFATDTGPGNTLIDVFTQQFFPGNDFDRDSQFARSGTCNQTLLTALKSHSFFQNPVPRTTGPELFSKDYVTRFQAQTGTESLSGADLLATLVRFSAETIAEAIEATCKTETLKKVQVYLSGGGMHNPLLLEHLTELLKYPLQAIDTLGIPGDAKEAVLFAVLANETVAGSPIDFGPRKNVPSVSMGKISFPD